MKNRQKNRIITITRQSLFFLLLFVLLFPVVLLAKQKVFVIPISGMVDPGMAAFLERTLTEHGRDPLALVVIEMDTFGGRVDSAFEIVEHMTGIPEARTLSYVTKRAISAGALIALAADDLVMKSNTLIGDCAPIIMSSEGPKMLGEKAQSPLRAQFRALAKRNGYPELLSESMVSEDMEVYQVTFPDRTVYMDAVAFNDLNPSEKDRIVSRKTIVAEGELLTMDDTEARELGFSEASVNSIEEALGAIGVKDFEIIRIQESWSEAFVRYIGSISQILMLIGLGALYFEYKSPGFGIFGLVGIAVLALVFFNQYLVGLADYTELLILLIGIALLGVEIFVIPGFGIAGISGLTIIGVSLILMMQGFVLPDPSMPWQFGLMLENIVQVLMMFLLVFVLTLFIMRFIFPRLSFAGSGPYLGSSLKASHISQAKDRGIQVGDVGVADTLLRPSGKIEVRNQLLDAVTDGEYIEKGTLVEIIQIDGNRIIVERKN